MASLQSRLHMPTDSTAGHFAVQDRRQTIKAASTNSAAKNTTATYSKTHVTGTNADWNDLNLLRSRDRETALDRFSKYAECTML